MIMDRTISLGKIPYSSKRHINAVDLDIRLICKESGDNIFVVHYVIWNASHTEVRFADQYLDPLKIHFCTNQLFMKIYHFWEKYQLNDWHAGTPEQEELVKGLDYKEACEVLKRSGLYEVTLPDGTSYRYGSNWLYEPIPEPDLSTIKSIIAGD